MILNIRGKLRTYNRGAVMGIINVTDNSFYSWSRTAVGSVVHRAAAMVRDGADILDLGACSTRPGSEPVSEDEELSRIVPAVTQLRRDLGDDVVISVDTFRSKVAREAVEHGADIINDISGGDLDADMFGTIASLRVPYIIMHMRGSPQTMQELTGYEDVRGEVLRTLAFKADKLRQIGVSDVIVDPGICFAKTIDQNYSLLHSLSALKQTGCPVLVGLSRKSMIGKELGITPEESLPGTIALNMAALMNGADILRVHDVKEARQTVDIFEAYRRNAPQYTNTINYSYHPKI